jgi:NADPH2:quinone reductase
VVISGAGGVGSIAVQLAKPLGARRVIATASSAEKRELTLELGADAALDPDDGDFTEALIEANGGERVDVVLEMAGGAIFDASRKALAPFGRMVAYGISSREPNQVSTGSLMRRSQAVVGFWLMDLLQRPDLIREALDDLLQRAARGDLRVVVGGTYPLTDVARAHEDIQSRRTSGKLLLDPSS